MEMKKSLVTALAIASTLQLASVSNPARAEEQAASPTPKTEAPGVTPQDRIQAMRERMQQMQQIRDPEKHRQLMEAQMKDMQALMKESGVVIMGPGMGMGPGMMHPGMGMGPGMMYPGMGMGPGMMYPGMGMGPGMMHPGMGMGPGMMHPGMGMGPGMMRGQVDDPLQQRLEMMERRLEMMERRESGDCPMSGNK